MDPYSLRHPLFATSTGVLYPVNILLLILLFDLASTDGDNTFPLAGIFTFLPLRELEASVAGSILAAVTFMLSGYLFSAHNVISTLSRSRGPRSPYSFSEDAQVRSLVYSCLSGLTLAVMFMAGGSRRSSARYASSLVIHAVRLRLRRRGPRDTPDLKRLGLWAVMIAVFCAPRFSSCSFLAPATTRAGGLSFRGRHMVVR